RRRVGFLRYASRSFIPVGVYLAWLICRPASLPPWIQATLWSMPIRLRLVAICLGGLGAAAAITVLALWNIFDAGKPRAAAAGERVVRSGCHQTVRPPTSTPVARGAGKIAFVRWAGGSYAVFVMAAAGGSAHRLSLAPLHAFPIRRHVFQGEPAWSP